jgi:hypothetical protein
MILLGLPKSRTLPPTLVYRESGTRDRGRGAAQAGCGRLDRAALNQSGDEDGEEMGSGGDDRPVSTRSLGFVERVVGPTD